MAEVSSIKNVMPERIAAKVSGKIKEIPPLPVAPIGIFDSGLGGLTVFSQIQKQLPNEDIIYIADTAHVPYGGRSPKEIIKFNHQIIQYLIKEGVKIIVMACGTSSAIAYPIVEKQYKTEIVSLIGPGSQAAVEASKKGRIGLLATVGTVNSGAYQKRIQEIKPGTKVFAEAAPLFVPLIEGGFIGSQETKKAAREYLNPLISNNIDTLILGCTHYPHLKKIIQSIVGPEVNLIDPAEDTVKEAKNILKKKQLTANSSRKPEYRFLVTNSPLQFKDIGSRLLGRPITQVKEITL
jgi:glutamate racemase